MKYATVKQIEKELYILIEISKDTVKQKKLHLNEIKAAIVQTYTYTHLHIHTYMHAYIY